MNENPEGTPNPLTQKPPVAPSQPVAPVQPAAPVQPVAPASSTAPAQPVAPTMMPEQPTALSTEPAHIESQATSEPSMKGSVVEPEKKPRKKAWLVVAIILLIAAIGAGVAAVLMLTVFNKKADAVPAAISKLFSEGRPRNVAIDGRVSLATDDPASEFSLLNVNFKTGIDTVTTANYGDADIVATLTDESELQFNASEVHTASGDLYLKLSGISDALKSYKPQTTTSTSTEIVTTVEECDDAGNCETIETTVPGPSSSSSTIMNSLGVFEVIDNEWIHIGPSDFSNITDLVQVSGPAQCLIDAAGNLGSYNADFTKLYQQHPFITYTTGDLPISQKNSALYRLGFDQAVLADFINSMSNYGFMNDLVACMGGEAVNKNVTASDLDNIVAALPTIYVEINDNNDFTRAYVTITSEDGKTSATADLNFSYPTSITVEEPENYLDYSKLLQTLLPKFYGTTNL